ncbi:TPA: hypothetical protein ACK2W2_001636 [Klebsiella michiganensis]
MNSARVLPAITPESSTGIPSLYRNTGDGHHHKMQDGTKCREFRPGENAAANQREGIGRKKVRTMLVAARNSGGHSTFLTHDSGLPVRLRVAWPG